VQQTHFTDRTDVHDPSTDLLANGWPAAWIADDPDAEATSPEAVYEAAQAYVGSGLSIIPITAEYADKSPDARRIGSWKTFQVRRPYPKELREWYEAGGLFGLAVIGGAVSGGQPGCGLEIIDFDTADLANPWIEAVEKSVPDLVQRLVRVQSPRPGLHVYYRCPLYGDCQKLACCAREDETENRIQRKKVTLIEMKAEGGYAIIPPSPQRCHPTNRRYRLVEGSPSLTSVPIISPQERAVLLEEARRFNRWTDPTKPVKSFPARARSSDGRRPGDDFERKVSWADILEPHGWVLANRRGDIEDWRRPGKDHGVSGTANYAGSGLFYPFSSNAHPFEEGQGYGKFRAYAVLNHGGDFVKAAQALRDEGYGAPSLPAGRRTTSPTVMTTKLSSGSTSQGETHVE
jgi:putative DNA primase/helicase